MNRQVCVTDTEEPIIDLNLLPSIPSITVSSNNDLRRDRRSQDRFSQTSSYNKLDNGAKHFNKGNIWPPISQDNWVKVMVVADGPMLKYHGEKLERYILTLMQTVSVEILFCHSPMHLC